MIKTCHLLDCSHTLAGEYLQQFEYPWQALDGIKELILSLGPNLGEDYEEVQPNVWVHKTATVFPSAYLGRTLHHWSGDRGAPLRLCSW